MYVLYYNFCFKVMTLTAYYYYSNSRSTYVSKHCLHKHFKMLLWHFPSCIVRKFYFKSSLYYCGSKGKERKSVWKKRN